VAKHSSRKWLRGVIIEETPEVIVFRYPDGSEVRQTNLKTFFPDPEKPKQPDEKPKKSKKAQKTVYPRDWNAYDEAQCREVALFMKLLAGICSCIEMPLYQFGRPRLPYSDMAFISVLKVFSTKSCRRFHGYIDQAVKLGYIEQGCHYSSISNFMRMSELTPLLQDLIRISSLPIANVDIEREFAVDSTGFSTSTYSRYFSYKHGKDKAEKKWIKCHACCGVKTKIITEVLVTDNSVGDSPLFKPLVEGTAKRFDAKEVSADKAYLSRANVQLVDQIGAEAFIPLKKNVKSWALGAPAWKKLVYYVRLHEDEFMQHYHKRSAAENVFQMMKAKFSHSLRSKDPVAQINEVLLKVLCHNICVVIHEMHELGIDPNFVTQTELSK
jgi:transposase